MKLWKILIYLCLRSSWIPKHFHSSSLVHLQQDQEPLVVSLSTFSLDTVIAMKLLRTRPRFISVFKASLGWARLSRSLSKTTDATGGTFKANESLWSL